MIGFLGEMIQRCFGFFLLFDYFLVEDKRDAV